ncbi:MAG: hypothetical protein ACYC2Y_04530 [Armatimonadota bacterium]
MKHLNDKRGLSPILRSLGFLTVMALITIGYGLAWANEPADSPIIAKCKADLAKRFDLQAQDIELVEAQPTTWPDTALGMPESGKAYAQVMTPGFRVILEARGSGYLYTTSTKAYRYGGPISIWSCSMLYSLPVQNEPNLNSDLYQCSLLGTNSILLVSGITDYYPQQNGIVIAKRRTSRSSHELLYVKADEPGNVKTLRAALDFGEAAINSANGEWAGYVRPSLGAEWGIVISHIDQNDGDAQTLPLPDGVKPGRIAWSGETLMILVKRGEQTVCFETSPKAGASEWKEAAAYQFPETSFMLNKSETLEISQGTSEGKPSVEIALVWFTGDRNVVATISDLDLQGYDLLEGRYAFVWGKRGSEPIAYTVDITTGETLLSYRGAGRDLKPFQYPPQSNPIVLGKSK